jgi:hypothetical protein
MDSVFPKIPSLEFLSPRHSVCFPFSTTYAAEDHQLHQSLNGTYDRLFPLYALTNIQNATSTTKPKFELIDGVNSTSEVNGDVAYTIFKEKVNRREMGRQSDVHYLANNVVLNTIYFREFISPKFSPQW